VIVIVIKKIFNFNNEKINQNQKTNLIFTVRNQTVVLVHDLHFAEQNFNLEAKRIDVKVKK